MKNEKLELIKLYESKIEAFSSIKSRVSGKPYGPFLMSPNSKYYVQKQRVLFIGQETYGWECYSGIGDQMSIYEGFNLGINYTSSPFWNVMRKIEHAIGNEYYSSAWTNISKFDIDQKRPNWHNTQIICELDNILLDEISIIKPDMCVFFTSNGFDYRLKRVFEGLQFSEIEGFKKNVFCKLSHANLPAMSFRTYHPRYLRMKHYETDVISFFKNLK